MILAIDTSTANCSAALFEASGALVDSRDELIGRGHAERLVPMIAELLLDRRPEIILVGVGPGSFTGIRVGIAAACGLAIGWAARLYGFSSLALLAASAPGSGPVAAVMAGGHGELFVQQFTAGLDPMSELVNLPPAAAAAEVTVERFVGSGAGELAAARGSGEATESWPSAVNVLKLPEALRTLPAKPLYARAADAKIKSAA